MTSFARRYLQDMLPNEDAVLYVDADTLFLNPVEEHWNIFEKMNESHLMALGYEGEDVAHNVYHQLAKHPYPPPFGTYVHRLRYTVGTIITSALFLILHQRRYNFC